MGDQNPAARAAGPEGVIKFTVGDYRNTGPLDQTEYECIEVYRARLWQLGLIGHSKQMDVGFGNISARRDGGGFVISGTQTGHKPALDGGDYVIVDRWDFGRNAVDCRGACLPSSESLSHAALYERPEIAAVIHVHSRPLWRALIREGALSTEEHIAYGSRQLYTRLAELATGRITGDEGRYRGGQAPAGARQPAGLEQPAGVPLIIVARGHQDGVYAAGHSLEETFGIILKHVHAYQGRSA
ncbi:MAG: class II aldolase/adducin family protein [Spirochaetaceae bacterium]|nr:MAG: class II aldolase/adducin family protein [Spirochaetaceae bacterium]